ncbi:leucyl aminopeptidase, partial [Candidatus Saganbacteria bacterium]|nr:leucyl aminopeptidase [Candidatus Saganbacteria bacterium]
MKIKVEVVSVAKCRCDLLAVGVFEGVKTLSDAAGVVDNSLGGLISKLLRRGEITGELGKVTVIHSQGKLPAERIAVIGLGKSSEFGLDEARTASAAVMRAAKEVKVRRVAVVVPGELDYQEAVQAVVEGGILGAYEFKGYATEKSKILRLRRTKFKIKELVILEKSGDKAKKTSEAVEVGKIIAEAENRVRDLVNAPSNEITPTYLANYARRMAKEAGLKCEILDPEKEGMEALLSVAKGSEEPPKVVVLKNRGSSLACRLPAGRHGQAGTKGQGMVALIGKGITFDSGGISLKPPKKMDEMKMDMAGAAAVIEVMGLLGKLKINKKVVAVIPLCENMPSGKALKPGDVVGSLSGKTVEIISTDAEGRMILADAITYARKLGANEIIDVATLTGGCVVALGD